MIDHFGLIAPFYDRVFKTGDISKLIDCLKLDYGEFVLDAGGGTGRIGSALRKIGMNIIVVDASFRMLQLARGEKDLRSVCCLAENMAFQNESFDRIMMIDTFHHVRNQIKTVKELWRIVKPGGRIVIQEPDINNIAVKLIAMFEKLLGMRSKFLEAEILIAMFEGANSSYYVERTDFHYYAIIQKD